MRILVANKFFYLNGGSEAVMLRERSFLQGSGHTVIDFSMHDERNLPTAYSHYFVSRKDYGDSRIGGLEKARAVMGLIHSTEAVRKITDLIRHERPDILHCHNIYHQLTPSIIRVANRHGVPTVLTLHDYKPVCPTYLRLRNGQVCSLCIQGDFRNVVRHRCADGSLSKSALLYLEAVVQRAMGSYEKVDRFLAPSRFMLESITAHRFSADKVELLYNGTDTSALHGTGRDDGYLLYLGRISEEKGLLTLLEAHGQMPEVRLVVAGSGPILASLRAQYPRAEFAGHLSGSHLHETIDRAGALVVPSKWYENCPMSIIEAMAYGKPVVASRIGGIPELIIDGETGLLTNPGDTADLLIALQRVASDPLLRRRFGAAARQRAEREFSSTRHNERLLQIYESLLTGRAAS